MERNLRSMNKFRQFYYKWHLVFFVLIVVCAAFVWQSIRTSYPPDLRIAYVSKNYMNRQTFNDCKSELEMLLLEATSDNKLVAEIETYSDENEDMLTEKLNEYIFSDNYDIYIADVEAFEAVEDKSVFIDTSIYLSQMVKSDYMLKDSDGRAYAVSIKDNSLIELFGASSTDGLYIAAAAEKGKIISNFRKNGSNICGYIIENKSKYNY